MLLEGGRHGEDAALVHIGWHAPLDRLADGRMPFMHGGANLFEDWLREVIRFRDVGVYSRILRHLADYRLMRHPVDDVIDPELVRAAGHVHRKSLVGGPLPV